MLEWILFRKSITVLRMFQLLRHSSIPSISKSCSEIPPTSYLSLKIIERHPRRSLHHFSSEKTIHHSRLGFSILGSRPIKNLKDLPNLLTFALQSRNQEYSSELLTPAPLIRVFMIKFIVIRLVPIGDLIVFKSLT